MAKQVHYAEKNVDFSDGPFVVVQIAGYLIEAQHDARSGSVLPDTSIYQLLREHGIEHGKTCSSKPVEEAVDWLNQMVELGRIVKDRGAWVSIMPSTEKKSAWHNAQTDPPGNERRVLVRLAGPVTKIGFYAYPECSWVVPVGSSSDVGAEYHEDGEILKWAEIPED